MVKLIEKVEDIPVPVPHRKTTRTISGVSPVAVVLPPRGCAHGACVYCPTLDAPQSYTPKSPAIMRARLLKYDPYLQVKARTKAFHAMGHPTDKIEIIVMGGTFLSYPVDFQYDFIKNIYDAMNDKKSADLDEAKAIHQENEKNRCVALCVETKPDWSKEKEIRRMLDFGTTRCELGIQLLDDETYELTNRGHNVEDVVEATQLLKDAGFKVGYHTMQGLPGVDMKKDIEKFEMMFTDSRFRPDQVKIYPTQVMVGSELVEWYKQGKYKPYDDDELKEILVELKSRVPHYVRIMRVMREIPPQYLVAGTLRIDLRNLIPELMKAKGKKCVCIRCREIGFALRKKIDVKDDLRLDNYEYEASGGKEFFLSIVNSQDIIFGLCRLRIPFKPWIDGITKQTMLVRELHVYGPEVRIKDTDPKKWQHRGLGKKLMAETELIARKNRCNKIAVISGVGVRNYYKKLGYELEGHYMVKYLN